MGLWLKAIIRVPTHLVMYGKGTGSIPRVYRPMSAIFLCYGFATNCKVKYNFRKSHTERLSGASDRAVE